MTVSVADARANEMLNTLIDNCNSGKLRIYSGVVPATADTALSGNTLLADLTMNSTSFAAAAAGVLTANDITPDNSADNTGTATFFRIYESDGTTPVLQGSVSATGDGGDLQLNTVSVIAGLVVAIYSLTLTIS